MEFDQNNKVVQLCAKGMELEGLGNHEAASDHFMKAWEIASNNFERFTAAHYVARHQNNVSDKLKWDLQSLDNALQIEDESIKATLPSLYLNIGKCYDELGDAENAKSNYKEANSFVSFLPDDGYGQMIKSGVKKALDRFT